MDGVGGMDGIMDGTTRTVVPGTCEDEYIRFQSCTRWSVETRPQTRPFTSPPCGLGLARRQLIVGNFGRIFPFFGNFGDVCPCNFALGRTLRIAYTITP